MLYREQEAVLEGLQHARTLFPFPILGIDTDNGSEFINEVVLAYCAREQITFTRGRPHEKRDQCFIEQKNGVVVRQVIGRDRFEGEQAARQLAELYQALRLYVNYFQPSMKLQTKTYEGRTVRRTYDAAKTPCQRLLLSGVLSASQQDELSMMARNLHGWIGFLQQKRTRAGKLLTARTIETYTRSARAFCNWLVSQGYLPCSPLAKLPLPPADTPIFPLLDLENFEQVVMACQPATKQGPHVEQAVARNRALLWLCFETGIRTSEVCALRLNDLDRSAGIVTISGERTRQRQLALGQPALRHLLVYLDQFRPDEEELRAYGKVGEDHLFLSETCLPLTTNALALLFARLRKRAGLSGKSITPQSLRRNFALRYVQTGGNPHKLQELLGYESIAQVKHYLDWYNQLVHGGTQT